MGRARDLYQYDSAGVKRRYNPPTPLSVRLLTSTLFSLPPAWILLNRTTTMIPQNSLVWRRSRSAGTPSLASHRDGASAPAIPRAPWKRARPRKQWHTTRAFARSAVGGGGGN